MLHLKGKTYKCTRCGWEHHETDIVGSLGAFLDGFSDPVRLKEILKQQSAERVRDAIGKHELECPGGAEVAGHA